MAWMIRMVLTIAVAQVAAGWQLTPHAASPSVVLAVATVALAAAIIAVLTRPHWHGAAPTRGPRFAVALRRKSWGAAFQRQRNPDAPGRPRPRAPSAAPAAA